MSRLQISVRCASAADVASIERFGQAYIPLHYAPLIGAQRTQAQADRWWNADALRAAIAAGYLWVADDGGIVGVGQRGRSGDDPVIYELYIHPYHRGQGFGPRLLSALIADMPPETHHVLIEHFAANERAGAFYEREGVTIDRIEPDPGGHPELAVVWRRRTV